MLLECLTECGAQLHAELSIASDTGNQLHRLADAQHISDALLRENALPGQEHIVQSLSRLQQKGRFFNQSVRCIQFDYDEPTGHLSFSAWAAEHMGVPKDLLLPDEVEETGFALADIARIQKALRATSAEHPYTELSMLLPVDGELRWHHVRLCSLWSDDSVPTYIGAAGQADPVEQFFDYHHDLYHDVLTNAYNRRFFEKQLRKLMEVDAVAMLDLDQFKQINDVYGHQAGDDALRILVSAVTACVRNRNDALVRYGGDEFLLIFPHIPEHVFIKRLEQIRATVQALHMIEYPDLHLTVSIGGVYGACPLDPGIRQADKLLYQAKECRNKCITAAFSAEEAEKPKPNQESDKLKERRRSPMTLQEFYDRIGGDYKATISRLPSEALIKKFVLKYPGDPSFNQLKDALAAQDWELAFRASHTLKGVAQNLGMDRLYKTAATLCDAVRGPKPLEDASLWPPVVAAHEEVLAAIREL